MFKLWSRISLAHNPGYACCKAQRAFEAVGFEKMGEVLEFPGFDERNWRGIEAAVADGLKQCGMPDDGIAWVQSELKRRLLHPLRSTTVSIEVPMPAALSPFARDLATTIGKKFQEQYRDILDALTGQIIWAVIELYLARLAEPPPSPPRKAQFLSFSQAANRMKGMSIRFFRAMEIKDIFSSQL